MKYIKRYWEFNGLHASIRTNTYCKTMSHIMKMLAEVRSDYPNEIIETEKMDIVIYGGKRFKGIMGIEFPIKEPNPDYIKISEPEVLL